MLFLIYLLLFCWLITKSRFIKKSGLSSLVLISLFLLKVFVGCVGYKLMLKISPFSDADTFHKTGLIEYHLLFSDPVQYITNIFQSGYTPPYGNFYSSVNSYWNDLGGNFIAKLLSLFDIFSGGDYYINTIFYSYLLFLASIGLFRFFSNIYPCKTIPLTTGCFLLPSFLFYSSYSHKDGLIFIALCSIICCYYFLYKNNNNKFLLIFTIVLSIFFIFILRNYVAVALLPALLSWFLCYKLKHSPYIIFTCTYIIAALLFFNTSKISPKINLLQNFVDRQAAFKLLPESHTLIGLDTLKPSFKSFVLNAPQATSHILLRPFLTDNRLSVYLIPYALEILAYQFIFLLFLFFRTKSSGNNAAIFFLYFFSFSVLVIIGFTIPIIGAFIRYRSIYLPFIITPMLCTISWQKIKTFSKINKNNNM